MTAIWSRKSKSLSAKKRRRFHQDPSHVSASGSISREREREEIFESNCTLAPPGFRGESSNKSDSLTGDCTDKVRLCLNWYFPWLCKFVFVCNSTSMECRSDGLQSLPCSKPRSVNCFAIVWLSCTNCATSQCLRWKMEYVLLE